MISMWKRQLGHGPLFSESCLTHHVRHCLGLQRPPEASFLMGILPKESRREGNGEGAGVGRKSTEAHEYVKYNLICT